RSCVIHYVRSSRLPPTSSLFPYTTLFRSLVADVLQPWQLLGPHLGGDLLDHLAGRDLVRQGVDDDVLAFLAPGGAGADGAVAGLDRKSTRLNSSHVKTSYAVFCLKKKKTI